MLSKPCIDAREIQGATADGREGVGEGVALAPGRKPVPVRVTKESEILLAVHQEQRLHAAVLGRLRRSDRREYRIDAARVLGRWVQLAVEKFCGRRVSPLPLVPETTH